MHDSFLNRSLLPLCIATGLALGVASGCKQKPKKDAAAATSSAATAGSGAATASAPSGPCGQLAGKVCEKAGSESPSCINAKTMYALLSDAACEKAIADFSVTAGRLEAQGKKCDELVTQLCAGVGEDTETCKMVTEKTKSFPPEQCVAMLANVDKIVADLKKEEAKNQPLPADQAAAIAATDAPSFGPADAKVTVVEFSDFECPYCSRAANVATQVKEKYGDKVRFVFRQFPLSFHQNAQAAAEASLEAHAQGKFWEFHDKLFANQRQLDRDSLEGYAKDLGLNVAKFKGALDGKQHEERVKSDMTMGETVAVQGTPTMFVNGKRVGNPTDFDSVSKAIEDALGS